MKKLLLAASLLVLGAQAKAALFINNNTNCTLNMTIFAFDPTHTGCWGLQSNLIVLGPNSSVSYNSVATLNTTSPFWFGGATASTAGGAGTWGWNAGKFFFTSGGGASVGLTSCGLTQSVTVPNVCGSSSVVTWQPLGNNIIIEAN
ncbi:hypothetical protein [Taibaiella koreensis]|uniref:hypothetical protein n=1 Tax=Taibaiella koreensis TaxID=1268548 RepID=UPI000E5990A2|nr:hypothetical protein [Taibaiella koreensis]